MNAYLMPPAEVDVSLDVVRRLIADQMPDLADRRLRMLAHGWDNVIVELGGDLLARLPRRAVAVDLLVHEQRWLPELAPRLPLPIPAPVRLGRPGPGYPWPWSVVPCLPGDIAARTPPTDQHQTAVSVAAFLAALHVPAPAQAPHNPLRGGALSTRAARLADDLDGLDTLVDRRAVTRLWRAALDTPAWDGGPVWLHGDLHPANILVNDGQVSAIVDFGDITAGDPATDLSIAWMLLPAGYRHAFRAAYTAAGRHPAGDDLWIRARGWALALSVAFLSNSADHPLIAAIGRQTLTAVLESQPGAA
jgi:aminoglycoside phosphotransferase (APT) family kinase protein